MKKRLAWLVLAFAIPCTPLAAAASPTSDLVKVEKTFYALKTFHADLAMTSASISMDFVRPDRVRETLSNGMVAVFIGSNAWMSVRGRTMPMPAGMAAPLQARLQSCLLYTSDRRASNASHRLCHSSARPACSDTAAGRFAVKEATCAQKNRRAEGARHCGADCRTHNCCTSTDIGGISNDRRRRLLH